MLTDSLRRRGDLNVAVDRLQSRTEAAARYLESFTTACAGRLSSLGETTAADVRLDCQGCDAVCSCFFRVRGNRLLLYSSIGDKRRHENPDSG
jgi:hypothetical protein